MCIIIPLLFISFCRKFRSQTSDNMDRWKADGKSQRREEQSREEKRKEEKRREEERRRSKRESLWGKSRNTVFFHWFVALQGRKVGSLKQRVRSHVVRWETKSLRRCGAKQHVQYFRQVESKNRKTDWYEAVSSALNFPFWKQVSQNCFVFDVVNLKTWGSLAELFRFWRCQVQKLRKSRRTVSFLTLSSSKIEEVSQNSCVFKLADRQIDR